MVRKKKEFPLAPMGVLTPGSAHAPNRRERKFSSLVVLVLTAVAKTPEGVVVGFQIFAWAPK